MESRRLMGLTPVLNWGRADKNNFSRTKGGNRKPVNHIGKIVGPDCSLIQSVVAGPTEIICKAWSQMFCRAGLHTPLAGKVIFAAHGVVLPFVSAFKSGKPLVLVKRDSRRRFLTNESSYFQTDNVSL
jgi:hypothetical protein